MSAWWRALATVAALMLECNALLRLADGAPGAALALHLAAAGMLAESYRRPDQPRAARVGWVWAALLPVYGVLVGAALAWPSRARAARPEEPWERQRREAARAALEERRRAQTVAADLLPLVDALHDRDPRLRASAVDTLRDARSAWAVRLLARERDNDVYDVRFRAVESLGRLSTGYLAAIAAAKRQLASDGSAETHRRLAELHLEYAELGLEDERVQRVHLEGARAHAERALRGCEDRAARLLLADASLRLDRQAEAAAGFQCLLAADPDDADALRGLAELCLRQRDLAGLRAACTRLHRGGHLSASRLRELGRLWRAVEVSP